MTSHSTKSSVEHRQYSAFFFKKVGSSNNMHLELYLPQILMNFVLEIPRCTDFVGLSKIR